MSFVRLNKPSYWIPLLYLVLAAAGWLLVGRVYEPDANFVLYRFVMNLQAGHGLVYLTPDSTVTTFPLGPILLFPLVSFGLIPPVAGGLITILSLMIGATFLARLLHGHWLVGIAYLLIAAVQPSPVVLLMVALALAALDQAEHERWILAGTLVGAAALADPAALVLAILALFLVLQKWASALKYIAPLALIILGWFILSYSGNHPSVPPVILVLPSLLVLALPAAALFTLFRCGTALRRAPVIAVLLAWSAITALLSLIQGLPPTAAILPGLIAVVSLLPWRSVLLAAACFDMLLRVALAGHFIPPPSAEEIGKWIATNTGPEARLATAELGAQSYYAGRPVIDLSGKIQPIPFDRFFFLHYVPDVVVLADNTAVPWEPFATTYAKMFASGGETVYQRVVNFSTLDDHPVDVAFGANLGRNDLHLSNVALGNTLHPGDLVRVRLDWHLTYRPSFDTAIKLTLLNDKGLPVQGIRDILKPDEWQTGPISTYHVIPLPADVPPGKLMLYLGVEIRAGSLGELKVAEVNVMPVPSPAG